MCGNIISEIFSAAIDTLDIRKYLKLLLMYFDMKSSHGEMDSKQSNKVIIRRNVQSHRPKYSSDQVGGGVTQWKDGYADVQLRMATISALHVYQLSLFMTIWLRCWFHLCNQVIYPVSDPKEVCSYGEAQTLFTFSLQMIFCQSGDFTANLSSH